MTKYLLLLLWTLYSPPIDMLGVCSQDLNVSLIALSVSNIEHSLEWYVENLNFDVERDIEKHPDFGLKLAILRLGNFHLELIEKENSLSQREYLPNTETYLSGVLKIGFRVHNIEDYFNQLVSKNDIEFLTELNDLPKNKLPIDWPNKYFLIKDPDGNMIQFFDGLTDQDIAPWLNMIVVEKLEKSISWYEKFLGFKHLETLGEPGNKRAILSQESIIIELFEPQNTITLDEITQGTEVLGFKKIAFGITQLSNVLQHLETENTTVLLPLQDADFNWATRSIIIADPDGNWTQLFEL